MFFLAHRHLPLLDYPLPLGAALAYRAAIGIGDEGSDTLLAQALSQLTALINDDLLTSFGFVNKRFGQGYYHLFWGLLHPVFTIEMKSRVLHSCDATSDGQVFCLREPCSYQEGVTAIPFAEAEVLADL